MSDVVTALWRRLSSQNSARARWTGWLDFARTLRCRTFFLDRVHGRGCGDIWR